MSDGKRKGADDGGMLGERTPHGGEKVSQKLHLGNSELILRKANFEAMLPAETKNLPEVIHVGERSLEKIKILST